MSRSVKLLAGSLLSLLALMLLAFALLDPREGTVEVARTIAPWPGAAGLVLLFLGLRSGIRKADATFVQMRFSWTTLLVGFGVSLGGVLVVYLFHFVIHMAPIFVVVGGMLAVPLGLFVAASSWRPACRKCDEPLANRVARFNSRVLPAALLALRRADIPQLLSQHKLPPEEARVDLSVSFCGSCRKFVIPTSASDDWTPLQDQAATDLLLGLEASRQPDEQAYVDQP